MKIASTWTVVAALAVLLLPRAAVAQPAHKPVAEALFQAGRELFDRGEIEEACRKFEASRRIEPALGTLLHLADCYERIGRVASSWALFEEGASLATAAGQEQRAEAAAVRAAALEPRISWVTVIVAGERPPGLAVSVTDVEVPPSSWGVPIPVDPGSCEIHARAPGYRSWSRALTISSAPSRSTIVIPPLAPAEDLYAPPAAPEELPEAPPAASFWNAQRIAGVVLGTLGLGGLVAGGILGSRAMVENDSSLSHCRPEDPSRCTATGVALRDSAEDLALGSTILFAAGGTALATGIVLFLTAGLADPPPVEAKIALDGTVSLAWGGAF